MWCETDLDCVSQKHGKPKLIVAPLVYDVLTMLLGNAVLDWFKNTTMSIRLLTRVYMTERKLENQPDSRRILSLPSGLELIGVRWGLRRYYNLQRRDRDIRNQCCLLHRTTCHWRNKPAAFITLTFYVLIKNATKHFIPTWITKSHQKTVKLQCYFSIIEILI